VRIIVIGGGKVGSFLSRELLEAGHIVTVIEARHGHAEALTDESKVLVLEGDGSDASLLKAADVHRADWVLAVTGLDEVNLMACQLALSLGAQHVLARLNAPLNRPTFEALDVPVVAVTDMMAELISREVEASALNHIAVLGRGRFSVYEIDLPSDFTERPLAEIRLPKGSLIITVGSGDEVVIPVASTHLKSGDRVTAVSSMELEGEVRSILGHPKEAQR
jgi:trk system potassium uptake protein TrkA